jgi:phospholipase C
MADDQANQRLARIQHIVVVMMENRSFDHMLGYLKRDGMPEVNGLNGDEFNLDPNGNRVPLREFHADASDVQRQGEALQKSLDPDHSKAGVHNQLGPWGADGRPEMGGFVKAFVQTRNPDDHVDPELWMVPMGHYTADDLPTYDYLARNYCPCDAWHSSVPGDTWPNRLYALAGREGEKVHPSLLQRLDQLIPGHALKALEGAPIYDVAAFTRQLRDEQWRWYSHDPATLRAADGHYRNPQDVKRENFAFYDRKQLSLLTEAAEELIVAGDSFLDDAANGKLRQLSWIDPNFIDLSVLETNSTDDHPPSDIRAGQAFILDVYEALRKSSHWDDTLLVIVYDEHGGFFDHQPPPPVDDDSGYSTLGVRVPALLVGPRVKKGVSHQCFQHTSLIKTILTCFADNPEQAIAAMPARVAASEHLGVLLGDEARHDIPEPQQAREQIEAWRATSRARHHAAAQGQRSSAPDGVGQPLVLQDFQAEFAKFALALRHLLPHGQP